MLRHLCRVFSCKSLDESIAEGGPVLRRGLHAVVRGYVRARPAGTTGHGGDVVCCDHPPDGQRPGPQLLPCVCRASISTESESQLYLCCRQLMRMVDKHNSLWQYVHNCRGYGAVLGRACIKCVDGVELCGDDDQVAVGVVGELDAGRIQRLRTQCSRLLRVLHTTTCHAASSMAGSGRAVQYFGLARASEIH